MEARSSSDFPDIEPIVYTQIARVILLFVHNTKKGTSDEVPLCLSISCLSSFVIVRMDRLDRSVFCDVELCELNGSLV